MLCLPAIGPAFPHKHCPRLDRALSIRAGGRLFMAVLSMVDGGCADYPSLTVLHRSRVLSTAHPFRAHGRN